MNYVKHLSLFGVEAKEIPCSVGAGQNPETDVVAGCLHYNSATETLDVCTSNTGNNPVWKPVGGSSEYFEPVETIGKNLLNPNTVNEGKYVLSHNGNLSNNANYGSSDYIAVEAGQKLVFQVGNSVVPFVGISGYDADKVFVPDSSGTNVTQYTVPDGVHYIRFYSTHLQATNDLTKRMVAVSETGASVPFEPYAVTVTYVLRPENNNDEYIKSVIGEYVEAVNAYLPKHIYCAVGRTIELYNNQVCLEADRLHMQWACEIGKALKRKFSVTGVSDQIGEYTLTLNIYDDSKKLVWEGSTTLHVVSDAITSNKSVCPIGDSLTNGKAWLAEVINLSDSKVSFVGSYSHQVFDADRNTRQFGHEGRSGFSPRGYIVGSPYTFGGATETPNNKFWDGSRFNWSSYKTNAGVSPDAVQIFLGTNGIADDNTTNAGYIKQMVDYIRQDDANIPIFVVNTIYKGNQNGIGVQQSSDGYASNSGMWKYNEDRKVMNLMKTLDKLLDGYAGVHMINLALTHDSEYNFGAEETPVNPRAAQTEFMPKESVHPQEQGYYQMADVIFSTMAGVFG